MAERPIDHHEEIAVLVAANPHASSRGVHMELSSGLGRERASRERTTLRPERAPPSSPIQPQHGFMPDHNRIEHWRGSPQVARSVDDHRAAQYVAASDRVDRVFECRERGQPVRRRCIAFVGEVVGGAREAVDRDDRRPQPRGDEPRRHGKVLVMIDRHVGTRSLPGISVAL